MQISEERLRSDIEKNASFGAIEHEGHGRTALAGTPPNGSARDYFVERLEDAGLDVKVDAVGNIVGRWVPKTADPNADAVAAGSHLDSVREGGMFDGPLGVYAALESVRAFQDEGVAVERPVEVVCFTEEEGQRFGSLLGSSVASGQTSVEDALAHTDDEGVTLAEGLETIGYAGDSRVNAEEWDAYLELHIEQGRRLESAGVPIGIVTGITGITQATVNIQGEANHAGTTSMTHRTDALAAASEFILDIERAANHTVEAESESAVGTVGREIVSPNSTNVIPGEVTLGVDIRDIESDSIANIVRDAKKSLERLEDERGVSTSYVTDLDINPVPMSDRCQDAMRQATEEMKLDAPKLPSGAGHDPMRIASVTDVGMLFARSKDGISHNPMEWTSWSDCATATRVLGESIANLASN
jgi:N-carbamoyl-L-amino-acid hydrolase